MTAVERALARAALGVDLAVDCATDGYAGYSRGQAVAAVAVELLANGYGCCLNSALVAAEAAMRVAEQEVPNAR
jgi:hypothetical protein